jgi:hypothetical protein
MPKVYPELTLKEEQGATQSRGSIQVVNLYMRDGTGDLEEGSIFLIL